MDAKTIMTWQHRVKINGTWEGDAMKLEIDDLRAALQSQAERIAELERESETHAKAYGLAIVERDNLHHELKVAQEGWRCECSTDDACRFARERDALRAQLATIAATEPHYWEYKGSLYQSKVNDACEALFTRPMPAKDAETGMINLPEPVGYIRSDQLRKVQDGWAYLCDVGPAPRIDKLPLYTEAQLKQAVRDALDALKDVAQTLAWMQHGKCRGFSDGLLTTDEALDKARTALSKYKGAK